MKYSWLVIILFVIASGGCVTGTKFRFEQRKLTIETIPSGARVFQVNSVDKNETFLGTTPIREQPVRVLSEVRGRLSSAAVDWMASQVKMLNVRIEKAGYENYEGNLATDPVNTTIHKITLSPK